MKGLIANPGVAPYVKESVKAYAEHHLLNSFYTTFVDHEAKKSWIEKILPSLRRRNFDELDYRFIKQKPIPELLRLLANKFLNAFAADKIWEWSELNFDLWVTRKLSKKISFVHTYEHAALSTLKRANELQITSFYEQPSQHHLLFTEIVEEQWKLYPQLKTGSQVLLSNNDSVRRNKRRDEELAVADFIICNSTFTKKSLISAGINQEKLIVIPYGFPTVKEHITKKEIQPNKVIFLYAGNLSLRKGIHLLIDAWKKINAKEHELWLVGTKQLPDFIFDNLPKSIKIYPNIPQPNLLEMMLKADVFILPTLADGFGMVISEAMSLGIPVICTNQCGGPDVITNNKDGKIIPANNKDALIEVINWAINNPQALQELGSNALIKSKSYPWSAYRKKLAAVVIEKVLIHAG